MIADSSVHLRRGPLLAAGLILGLLLLGAAWAYSSPVGSSPDDDFHLSSIWCSRTAPADLCQELGPNVDPSKRDVLVPAVVSEAPIQCFALNGFESAECVEEFAGDGASPERARANGGLYPSAFYDFLGLFVTTRPAESVLLMRGITWTLTLGLLALAVLVARPPLRTRVILAVLVTSVPLAIFLLASINPSAPTIAGTVAYACAALAAFEADTSRRTAASIAVAVAAAMTALVARPDAGAWLITASGMVLALNLSRRALSNPRFLLPVLVSVVSAGMLFTSQATKITEGLKVNLEPRPLGQVLFRNVTELPSLWVGSLGTWSIGWFDTPMPALVWVSMIGAFSAVVFTGIRRLHATKVLALAIGFFTLVAFPLLVLAGDGSVVGEGVQPRYLLPVLPVIVVAALATRPSTATITFSRSQLVTIGLVISLANSVALHTNLRRYVWGVAEDGFNLDRDIEWWWGRGPTPMTVWVVGTVAFALVATILLGYVAQLQRSTATGTAASITTTGAPQAEDALATAFATRSLAPVGGRADVKPPASVDGTSVDQLPAESRPSPPGHRVDDGASRTDEGM